jgi:hypothetical protein
MNSSIILAGRQPDIVNTLARADQAVANRQNQQHTMDYRNALQEHGAGALQGNQASMNALAGYDPQAMQNMQVQRQNADLAQRQEARLSEQHKLELKKYADSVSAAQLEQERAATEQAVMQGAQLAQSGDLQGANMVFAGAGLPPIDSVDQLPALVGVYEQAREYLDFVKKQTEGPEPDYEKVGDGQFIDMNNPNSGARDIPNYRAEKKGPLVDMSGASFGPEGPGVTDKFYEKLDGKQADIFGGILELGMTAPSRMAKVDEIGRLLSQSPTGMEAAIKYTAGQFGINTEGLSDLQAAQALINQIVPEQRPPGSGPMSDADLALFIQSMPRLINTPGGNQQIVNTMRGIIAYEMQQAEIARKVSAREVTPAEGMAELASLKNPLQVYRKVDGPVEIGGYTIEEVTE